MYELIFKHNLTFNPGENSIVLYENSFFVVVYIFIY